MICILPYKLASQSAKSLVQSLNNMARIKNKVRAPRFSNQLIINWGSSQIEFDTSNHEVINKPMAVKIASNKLKSLQLMKDKGVSVCDFTTDKEVVKQWLIDGYRVFARHLLTSHSGKGIEILYPDNINSIPTAPLYTKYHKKTNEFRVHVFDTIVIDYIEKKARTESTRDNNFNTLIRSYNNGWVYCRDNILHLDSIKLEAIKAVKALGLDFAAVDVVLSKNKPIVLECNTAPGLQGSSLEAYKNAILSLQRGI